jgi:hypothetical protein
MGPYAAYEKHKNRLEVEEMVTFYSIRREFIENRETIPPYNIPPVDERLPKNFDFAKYQSIFLGNAVCLRPPDEA